MKHLVLSVALLAGVAGCGKKKEAPVEAPPITEAWSDSFERSLIGDDVYNDTGGGYRIVDGALSAKGSHNHPLWLKKTLPRDVAIELDVWSNTPDGDIKVELFGDGRSYDPDKGAYKPSGYVVIMGGWKNSKSMIARKDEHGKDLVTRKDPPVEPGRKYHWKITRKGDTIEWFVDDLTKPFLSWQDPAPLEGPRNAFFSFNNWESDSWFDNLTVTPL
jgi:hypothetical protein